MVPPIGELLSVNVARSRLILLNGQPVKTGIYKAPVDARVTLADDHVEGDQQADRSVHGGPDKAVYAYASEDYAWWAGELERETEPGLFGENLTTAGIDVSGALVGERWRIGGALLEVSEPRQPCSKLGVKMGDPRFLKRFAKGLRPGAYLRIVEPGEIGAGDPIEIVQRPAHDVSVALMTRALYGERELAPLLLEAPALTPTWRQWAESKAD